MFLMKTLHKIGKARNFWKINGYSNDVVAQFFTSTNTVTLNTNTAVDWPTFRILSARCPVCYREFSGIPSKDQTHLTIDHNPATNVHTFTFI